MTNLSILQWNAQGMTGHGEELSHWLFQKRNDPFHLLCIQETWFNETNILKIPNYSIIPKNRDGNRGGCAIYIHNTIDFEVPPQDNLKDIEAQLIKIQHEKTISIS